MKNVKIQEGNMTTLEIGQLGKEVIHVSVGHFVWSEEEKAKFVRSKKIKEVADKIAELLQTIDL